jgi:NCAIR mutase (PurE)-related protein
MGRQSKYFEDLGFAKVDHHRSLRQGFPEVIYCANKTPTQIEKIIKSIQSKAHPVLATRITKSAFNKVFPSLPKTLQAQVKYHADANLLTIGKLTTSKKGTSSAKLLLIVTAGTSDIPIAREAEETAKFLGLKVKTLNDVGVAGVHRLLNNLKLLRKAKGIIVIAGMEGALASVVGGLVDVPVIAVPTSVGYGASFKGLAALLAMLNSCAAGVTVVNIDNGFGAAVAAWKILKTGTRS